MRLDEKIFILDIDQLPYVISTINFKGSMHIDIIKKKKWCKNA